MPRKYRENGYYISSTFNKTENAMFRMKRTHIYQLSFPFKFKCDKAENFIKKLTQYKKLNLKRCTFNK